MSLDCLSLFARNAHIVPTVIVVTIQPSISWSQRGRCIIQIRAPNSAPNKKTAIN